MQLAEMYVQKALRLVVWRHAGHLVKKLELAVDGQPLPKPYLGTPISDVAAAFLAVSNGPVPDGTVSLVFKDQAGTPVFRSDDVRVRPLAEVREGPDGADVYDKLLARILRHAPEKLPGWTDQLSDELAGLRLVAEPSDRAQERSASAPSAARSTAICLRGAIDFIDGRRVAGWATDFSSPDKVLRLQFEVNGTPAGTAIADEPRGHLDAGGAEFRHGFHVLLRKEALKSPWREVHRLRVLDIDTGRVVIDGHPLRYRPGQDERDIGSFARRIDRLEQTLLELREQVPHLRRRAAYSLEEYDLWFRDVHEPALRYEAAAAHEPPPVDAALMQAGRRIRFGASLAREVQSESRLSRLQVVVPLTADCTLEHFQRVLESLAIQSQHGHQYLVVNISQDDEAYKQLFPGYVKRVPKLRWVDLRARSVPVLLRAVLRDKGSRHSLFLEPQEALGPNTLDWMVRACAETTAKIVYADSDCIDEVGVHRDPKLRPDFNPDLLLSTAYIGAFCIERGLLQTLARDVADAPHGVWQYDLLLRAAERIAPGEWRHIAGVLTHRLAPSNRDPDASGLTGALSVLRAHLHRMEMPAEASVDDALYRSNPQVPRSHLNFAARLRWQVPNPAPKVSIIIPTRDAPDLLRTCVESIQARTRYSEREILLVDHESTDPEAQRYLGKLAEQPDVHVLPYTGAFNWSAMNNFAASRATGEVFCFLNNDTEVMHPNWLAELTGHALRPEIGAVGAKLLFRDDTLQHGGVIVGVHGFAEHAFAGLPADQTGYMMRAGVTQNLSAVTGACLVCRREVFDAVGGFEMVNLGVAFNDVDFCLRLAEAGYRIVWTPYARLYHDESRTRGRDWAGERRARLDREMAYMRQRWGERLKRDPYYNPAFERYDQPYAALSGVSEPALAKHCNDCCPRDREISN